MKNIITILLILTTLSIAEGGKRHALTLSTGIPGLVLPELGYEYSINESNKIGLAAGTFVLWPEYRINYVRMVSSFELMGSVGYVPSGDDDDDDGLFDDLFESILSGGTDGAKFVSATGGYRYTSDGGFIFRVAGGGGHFFNSDDSRFIPFLQLGIGYGF